MDRIWVSGWGCVALALTLLVLPLPWVAAAVLAAAVHELCHYLAIAALGGQVGRIAVGSGGAAMELGCLSPVRELLAAAAGPVGSLSLMLMGRFFPRLALCGLVQGLFNLLPIYPLDGGRILRRALELGLPDRAAAAITCWTGFAFALCGTFFCLRLGFLPGAVVFLAAWIRGNRACTEEKIQSRKGNPPNFEK